LLRAPPESGCQGRKKLEPFQMIVILCLVVIYALVPLIHIPHLISR
jgi:hypothetical protein